MKLKLLFLFIPIFISSQLLYGQNLVFHSDNKTKIIKASTFIEIVLTPESKVPCDDCETNTVSGKLISSQNDSITMMVSSSRKTLIEDERNVFVYKIYKSDTQPVISISKNEVMAVKQKGIHRIKKHTTGQTLGILLTLFGSSFIIGSAGVIEDDNRNQMLIAGVSSIFLGIGVSEITKRKLIVTSEFCPRLKEGKRIWAIE